MTVRHHKKYKSGPAAVRKCAWRASAFIYLLTGNGAFGRRLFSALLQNREVLGVAVIALSPVTQEKDALISCRHTHRKLYYIRLIDEVENLRPGGNQDESNP